MTPTAGVTPRGAGSEATRQAPVDAFQRLAPLSPDYATLPIQDGFNWTGCFAAVEAGQWYLVVFRSTRRETADQALLTEHDDRAHAEASVAPGFLYYFKGHLGERRTCLSFCLWDSRARAKAAAHRPLHTAAARIACEMYESYVLERYVVTKRPGAEGGLLHFECLSRVARGRAGAPRAPRRAPPGPSSAA